VRGAIADGLLVLGLGAVVAGVAVTLGAGIALIVGGVLTAGAGVFIGGNA
jgi:hypothetical protein